MPNPYAPRTYARETTHVHAEQEGRRKGTQEKEQKTAGAESGGTTEGAGMDEGGRKCWARGREARAKGKDAKVTQNNESSHSNNYNKSNDTYSKTSIIRDGFRLAKYSIYPSPWPNV